MVALAFLSGRVKCAARMTEPRWGIYGTRECHDRDVRHGDGFTSNDNFTGSFDDALPDVVVSTSKG